MTSFPVKKGDFRSNLTPKSVFSLKIWIKKSNFEKVCNLLNKFHSSSRWQSWKVTKLPRSKVIKVKGQQGHRGQMSPRSKRSKVTKVKPKVTKVTKVREVKDQVQGQMLWFFQVQGHSQGQGSSWEVNLTENCPKLPKIVENCGKLC